MLGEIVEFDFDVQVNERVAVGQVIGWIEAFKAVSDVYCTLDGEFLGANPNLEDDPSLLDSDPEADGWIYSVDGAPDEACVDALGYSRILDQQIDRMTGKAE
jgi:glycine cleavage system H protein